MRLMVFVAAACLFALPASASVVAHIDHLTQRMTVVVNGTPVYSWPVSTGRSHRLRNPGGKLLRAADGADVVLTKIRHVAYATRPVL